MRNVEIIVEDVTRILNIQMTQEVNILDEVVVKKRFEKPRLNFGVNMQQTKTLSIRHSVLLIKRQRPNRFGLLKVESFRLAGWISFPLFNIDLLVFQVERPIDDPLNPIVYLRGANMGMFPAIYDVDGLIFTQTPTFVMVENIERIAIMSGLSAGVRYGGNANGGVIVINTKGANFFNEPGSAGLPYDQAKLRNNIYENDALGTNEVERDNPIYLNRLLACSSEAEAMEMYQKQVKMYSNSYFYVLDAYDIFANKWKNDEFADEIIKTNYRVFENNPVALKALTYHYEAEGKNEKVHETYKKIFLLRPNYTQSYLNLANSYRSMGEYKRAATIYARYGYLVEEGFLFSNGDQSIIMERELNNLITLKGKELLSKRDLKKYILDDEFDGTRLVFEWSDSEAEFELQFVNPEDHYYKSERSLIADAERVKNEKLMGLSTEEYLIDNSTAGIWRVNATYLGNKSLKPAYLKATIYHNYGRPSQRKEVKLFKLRLKNTKQQLFTVSNTSMVVSN